MNALTAFRLTQGFYWLFLGTWFGAMVMLVIGEAITFRTVREYRPTLGLASNHPSMADNAAGILAGGVTGNILKGLRTLQIVCRLFVRGHRVAVYGFCRLSLRRPPRARRTCSGSPWSHCLS